MAILIRNGNIVGGGSGTEIDIVTSWEETPSDTKVPSEKLVKDSIVDLHCDIGNVRIGEVEDTTLGEHAHLMGFTSSSKADPVIRYINYKEDGKTSSERLLLSYESSTEDLLIKGNANDKYTEFRLSDYAKATDVDNKADKSEVPTLLLKNATLIPDNADLNDYHDIGEFYIPSATNAATMTNAPWSDSGCKITIDDNYSGENLRFMTAQAAPGRIAQRHYSATGGTWGWSEWRYIYETRDTYSSTVPWAMSGKAVASALAGYLPITKLTGKTSYTINPSDYHMIFFDCTYSNTRHKATIVVGANGACEAASGSSPFVKITNTSNTSVTITGQVATTCSLICI